jgi:hypothetical protein
MKNKKEDLPGITLYIKEHELTPCVGKVYKSAGFITLRAEVNDLDVWDRVVEKLDGMTIYTVNDLTGAVIQAAQRRANRAEKQAMKSMEDARRVVDELEARNSFLENDNENLKRQLEAIIQERDELQEVVDIQDQTLQGP